MVPSAQICPTHLLAAAASCAVLITESHTYRFSGTFSRTEIINYRSSKVTASTIKMANPRADDNGATERKKKKRKRRYLRIDCLLLMSVSLSLDWLWIRTMAILSTISSSFSRLLHVVHIRHLAIRPNIFISISIRALCFGEFYNNLAWNDRG